MDVASPEWLPALVRGLVFTAVFTVGYLLAERRWKEGDDRVDADNGLD